MHRNPLKEVLQNGSNSQCSPEALSNIGWKPSMDLTEAVTILGRGRNKPLPEGVVDIGCRDHTHVAETTTPTVVPKTPLKPNKPGQYPISRTLLNCPHFKLSSKNSF